MSGLQFFCDEHESSISVAMREFARSCYRLGYDIGVELTQTVEQPSWGRTSIRHLLGRPRQPVVCVTWNDDPLPSEFAGLPRVRPDVYDGWGWSDRSRLDRYATYQLMCPTSERMCSALRTAGHTGPIEQVPLGVNGAIYQPWPRDYSGLMRWAKWPGEEPKENAFFFLVAGYLQPRKGLEVALEAFRKAFAPTDNVALLIKTVREQWGKPAQRLVDHGLSGWPIGVCEDRLSEWDFARLLASVDCVVSPHHQEGFGMVPLQAMASGTQVIATDFAGPAQYLTQRNALLLRPRRVGKSPPDIGGVPKAAEWAYLSSDELAELMREAAIKPSVRRVLGGLETARMFSWDNAAQKLMAAIETHICPLRKRPRAKPYSGRGSDIRLVIAAPVRNSSELVERWAVSARETLWPWGATAIDLVLLGDACADNEKLEAVCKQHGIELRPTSGWLGEWGQRARAGNWKAHGYLFLTDVDVQFTQPGWAQKCVIALGSMRRDGVVHPVLLDGQGKIWSAGTVYGANGLPTSLGSNGAPYPRQGLEDAELVGAPGAGWFLRLETARRWFGDWMGGYHPTMHADTDMALWLRAHGLQFMRCGSSVVTHHHGSFTSQAGPQIGKEHEAELIWWWGSFIDHDRRCQELSGQRVVVPTRRKVKRERKPREPRRRAVVSSLGDE